jgi:hypothetical protein
MTGARLVRWVEAATAALLLAFLVAFIALKIPPIGKAANDPGLYRVSAEKSMGFHNPQKAMNTLGRSIHLAHQARLKAELSCALPAPGFLAGAQREFALQ